MTTLQFAPLPPKTAGRPRSSKYDAVVAQLRERPGEWALVAKDVPSGTAAHFKRRGAETTTRNNRIVDGRTVSDVWARVPS